MPEYTQSIFEEETALAFPCKGSQLIGILHHARNSENIGVVIVVGGPQTRVGSHRQFVQIARALAKNDIPVLRFDYRGMGDSDGDTRDFECVEEDICAAVDVLQKHEKVRQVVLWGLCDAASAISSYAYKDKRIRGVVLLNPWVRTTTGIARTYMRAHYFKRLINRELWAKMARGELNVFESVYSFVDTAQRALNFKKEKLDRVAGGEKQAILPLPDRIIDGIDKFDGSTLLIISGNDITAQEFYSIVENSNAWRRVLNRGGVMRRELIDADHTFSDRVWSQQVEAWTIEWVKML